MLLEALKGAGEVAAELGVVDIAATLALGWVLSRNKKQNCLEKYLTMLLLAAMKNLKHQTRLILHILILLKG